MQNSQIFLKRILFSITMRQEEKKRNETDKKI